MAGKKHCNWHCSLLFIVPDFSLFTRLPPPLQFQIENFSTTNPCCSRALQRQSRFGASPSHTSPSPRRRTLRLTSPLHSLPELESMVHGLLSRVWERKGASLVRHLKSIISIGRTTWRNLDHWTENLAHWLLR
ncbi:uncharacterized protein LOC126611780 [Malus sylvestris]|uniref:uncharacterized protein LOC126611780 n=1 Tax=Malus sylvestris TaxID=3752 RepID=UPI0021AC1A12|nr:uncharacterized protein LOC126611780 [Malus sylvestris]